MKSTKTSEYKKMLKEAKKQPGIIEVMKVHGKYDELIAQSQQYLNRSPQTEYFSVATSTDNEI